MEVDGGKHCYQKLQWEKKWVPIASKRERKGWKKYEEERFIKYPTQCPNYRP